MAILLVEQNVARALDIADRAYVLEQGRVVDEGTPAVLQGQSRIQEAYWCAGWCGGPAEVWSRASIHEGDAT